MWNLLCPATSVPFYDHICLTKLSCGHSPFFFQELGWLALANLKVSPKLQVERGRHQGVSPFYNHVCYSNLFNECSSFCPQFTQSSTFHRRLQIPYGSCLTPWKMSRSTQGSEDVVVNHLRAIRGISGIRGIRGIRS